LNGLHFGRRRESEKRWGGGGSGGRWKNFRGGGEVAEQEEGEGSNQRSDETNMVAQTTGARGVQSWRLRWRLELIAYTKFPLLSLHTGSVAVDQIDWYNINDVRRARIQTAKLHY
jgi:hypothetical protein